MRSNFISKITKDWFMYNRNFNYANSFIQHPNIAKVLSHDLAEVRLNNKNARAYFVNLHGKIVKVRQRQCNSSILLQAKKYRTKIFYNIPLYSTDVEVRTFKRVF